SQPLSCADQKLHGFRDLNRSDEIRGGIENAGGLTGCECAPRDFREDAGQAGGFTGQHVHGHCIRANRSRVDPRFSILYRKIVNQVARPEVVGAIEHKFYTFEERNRLRCEVFYMRLDTDFRVDGRQLARSRFGLGKALAGILLVEEELALEIAGLHIIPVDNAEGSHACSRKQSADGGAYGAGYHDGDIRSEDAFLTFIANSGLTA